MNKNADKKILIIEDEQVLSDVISQKFKEEGYQVFVAADGIQGMEQIRSIKPDLVFLDLVMPKKDGMEVLEDIRMDESLRKIPVVVISNSGQQTEIERIVGLGVRDYIIKAQFSPDEVLEKVKKYLNQEYTEKGAPVAPDRAAKKGIKILLVEDDQFLSSLLALKLEKEGYSTTLATDGSQVLSVFETNTPDLALMDIVMPEMNGIEVLKQIRSQPKYKDVLIIMFSNLGQDHEIAEAKKAGADDFLVKVNFTLKEVITKINTHLQKKGKL